MENLQVQTVPLDKLVQDPANARSHSERNIRSIAASLKRFGQVEPLVVQKSRWRVVGGNGRVEAMRSLGWTEANVVVLDLSDIEATSLAIALNRTAELATWDEDTLARLLEEMQRSGELDPAWFTEEELDNLLTELHGGEGEGNGEDPGEQEPPADPVTTTGDLWILGGHRLLCGDSTNPRDMERLMDGQTAVLLATDPPYLVDYDGTNHPAEHHKKAGRKKTKSGNEVGNKHWDDYIDPEASVEFFEAWLRIALEHCVERVPVYQWHATRRQALVEAAWERNDLLIHQAIIWAKPRGVLTRSHFMWQHEPCFYGWPEGKMPIKARRPSPDQTTIWEIGGESDGIHPTQKPLEVFTRPMKYHTRKDEICLEPFSGSGSQIIAGEKEERRVFAMEQSPAFVQAAILRWEKMTGQKAHREDGITLSDLGLPSS